MSSVTLTTDRASSQPTGTMITLTATGSGGATPYAYRFWVQPWGGAWQIVRDWGPAATYVWTAAALGGHNLAVEARSAGATAVEVQSAIGFVIAPAP
jgi:cell wall-associated protease